MNKRNHSNIYINILSWAAVLLCMTLIFSLSSQVFEESNQFSTRIAKIVVNTIKKIAPNASFDTISFNYILRKSAHFLAYFLLGILVISSLRKSRMHKYRKIVLAIFICVLYAISDEMHQMFVSGRGPGMKDVIIDGAGAMVGVGFHFIHDKRIGLSLPHVHNNKKD